MNVEQMLALTEGKLVDAEAKFRQAILDRNEAQEIADCFLRELTRLRVLELELLREIMQREQAALPS